MPQLVALMPPMIDDHEEHAEHDADHVSDARRVMQDQMEAMQENATAMGKAFDASKNDDSFYLPPEVFNNADFKRGMKNFISPDGKAVRFIISHDGDPATAGGHLAHRRDQAGGAEERSRARRWRAPRSISAGTAATYKDMQDGSNYDLLIAGIASLCLIFIIMLIITRSRGRRRR